MDGIPSFLGSGRSQSPCSQIQISPAGSTLIANADELSFVQHFEYFKKDNSFEFSGLVPMQATCDEPTVIGVGKKFVAVARQATDNQADVQLLGLDGAGRMRLLSQYNLTSGMTQIDSIALVQNDTFLLAISDTNDALKSFATN